MDDTTTSEALPSFRALVEQHKKRVYYLALDLTGHHHDAEGLLQEVFIKAHRHLDSFRCDAFFFFSWLYRITVNTYLNKKRKKVVRYMTLWDDFEHITQGAGAPSGPAPDYLYAVQNDSNSYVRYQAQQALRRAQASSSSDLLHQ